MEKYILLLIILVLVKCDSDEIDEIDTGEYATIIIYYVLSTIIIILSLIFINSKI